MNFSNQEHLDYTTQSMNLTKNDCVSETATDTCACGLRVFYRPFVKSVVYLEAIQAVLDVGKEKAERSCRHGIGKTSSG
jgi:hypothetical protein